jgi:hypothetical protein
VSDTTPGKVGRARLERASERLQEVWQALCRRPITATFTDIQLHNTSTNFLEMKGTVEEFKSLFDSPGSALVVSGKDGIASDGKGFLRFLESAQHPVELFFIEEGALYLQVSSVRLREKHSQGGQLDHLLPTRMRRIKEREQNRQTTSSINHNRRDRQTQECYLAMSGGACMDAKS